MLSSAADLLTLSALACFVASLGLCELVRRFAHQRALLDAPNQRSLHTRPTPRLGGVGIVLTTLGAALLGWPSMANGVRALVIACAALALVGLRDDVKPLSAKTRILVQVALSSAFLWYVGVPPLLLAPEVSLAAPSAVVAVVLVVWIVGVLNIYNFMDGMDGLAGFQTVVAAGVLFVILGANPSLSTFAITLGAAALGFFAQNFPPARMFMGDAGSTFIGMSFAALAVMGMHDGIPLSTSALALAPFLLDGTFTIVRRASRGERIWEAHRSHLYQRAVQAGLGHREVLIVYMAWMAVSAGAAVVSRRGVIPAAAAWLVVLLGLFAVWRWVLTLESNRANAA